jgi:hypothetical protein
MRTSYVCLALVTACSAKIGAPSKSGVIGGASAVYVESGAPHSQSNAEAAFSTGSEAALAACTKTATVGTCSALRCAISADAAPVMPSAGTITMRVAGRTVVLSPSDDHTYPAWQDASAALWSGGEELTIEASGAEVPAFSGTLTAPPPLTVRAPALSQSGAMLSIRRADGLELAWDPVEFGTVVIALSGVASGGGRAVVTCTFPAGAGVATIPALALAAVEAGGGSLTVATRSMQKVEVGDYAIQLQADTQGRTGDGRRFTSLLSIE